MGPRMLRICNDGSSMYTSAAIMAALYHRFENPRILASKGITSRVTSPCIHRQSGAPSRVSSVNPALRRRSENAMYSGYDEISAIASTSMVARTADAASSVISRPVEQPPTKTSSPRSGFSSRAAESSSSRLGSRMDCRLKATEHDLHSQIAFPRASVPNGVNQG